MLAFVDESGDTGSKISNRSSRYFVVAVVVFRDKSDAQACDDAIAELRMELYPQINYEFHYAHRSQRVKEIFIRSVSQCLFTYHTVAIDKAPQHISSVGLEYGDALHRFSILKALELSMSHLDNANFANITIDNGGERKSKDRLTSYLRQNLRRQDEDRTVRKIKMQDSKANNLLQLADYVAGIVNRALRGEPREADFMRQYLAQHEASRTMLP